MNNEIQLRWSDVWLLLSVYFASFREQPRLREILAAADYINHAIINYEELSSGLVRLKKAGFVIVDDTSFTIACSSSALSVIEPVTKHIKSAYDTRKELERQLNAIPWAPKDPIPHPLNNLEFPGFTKKIYDSAVSKYLESMKAKR